MTDGAKLYFHAIKSRISKTCGNKIYLISITSYSFPVQPDSLDLPLLSVPFM